jgi:hypothetical protein
MAPLVKLKAPPAERLKMVLEEALPLDDERLAEWRVWLAFWAAAATTPPLAAENRRRYARWRDLVSGLVAGMIGNTDDAGLETDLVVALVDGLGLNLSLRGGDAADLSAARVAARESLGRHLDRLGGTAP